MSGLDVVYAADLVYPTRPRIG